MLRDALKPLLNNLEFCQHPGLLLDRYYPGNENLQKEGKAKTQHFEAMVKSSKINELTDLYKHSFERWKKSLPAENNKSGTLETAGRMVLGLGKASVLETGIHLHHHLGYPFIPGSSLKGICAHYCSKTWGANNPEFKSTINDKNEKKSGQYHQFLFGDTNVAGSIGFEDAWWVPVENQNPFHMDIMTPHHSNWQKEGKAAPADYDSPTPVSFVSYSGSFHFCISWQGQAPSNNDEKNEILKWMELAWNLLVEALTRQGVGSKTSSGYGMFDEEKYQALRAQEEKDAIKKAQALKTQAQLEAMSPLERSMKNFLDNHSDKRAAKNHPYQLLYEELKKNESQWIISEEDRKSVAEEVKKGLQAARKWTGRDSKIERTDFIKKILGEI